MQTAAAWSAWRGDAVHFQYHQELGLLTVTVCMTISFSHIFNKIEVIFYYKKLYLLNEILQELNNLNMF